MTAAEKFDIDSYTNAKLTFIFQFLFLSLGSIFLVLSTLHSTPVQAETQILRMGVHPLYSPQKIHLLFSPICEQLSQVHPSYKCVLETSRDYADYNEKIKKSHFQILMPNPYQTIKAQKYGYDVIAKWGSDELFRGIILVRKDSKITQLNQLKKSIISFPAPTALAACLMPKYLLFKNGLVDSKDYQSRFVGSQESSIYSVLKKDTLAGVTWLQPWNLFTQDHPTEAQELMVLAQTEQLPNNSVMIHSKIPVELKKEVETFFVQFHQKAENKVHLNAIGMDQFEAASQKTYLPVEKFLRSYERDIKKVEW